MGLVQFQAARVGPPDGGGRCAGLGGDGGRVLGDDRGGRAVGRIGVCGRFRGCVGRGGDGVRVGGRAERLSWVVGGVGWRGERDRKQRL